eukprot:Protomagalhaensia_wolfi_Nauph_80__4758@NODE_494_length_2438_cov_20_672780_g372_i0_p1_GENE_NODE_494_length_2438_cov_20_672780_g372_i0NODE_494_length_2438_cov_20_672780_g372_i0_p1_ORF_typecomplete_len426_score68_40PDCD7/PF16021_5/0_015DUF4303/PF14136_6/0_074DUF5129/PF17173_4/1_4DUF3584/PF12128_8/1_9FUSC/PF04632_12/4ATPsynt_B/PF00430_18/0_26ATPsynt_B/PF00430_18/2_9e03_NODE_494_length_2438_cov_20_672780_g372_i011212398
MRSTFPRSSEFHSARDPLSPPHPDKTNPSPSWAAIATEQLKLLDDLQSRWEVLRQREAALEQEQSRWAEWRAEQEDAVESAKAAADAWIARSEADIRRQREVLTQERAAWQAERRQQEEALLGALTELREEGTALSELQRRQAISKPYCEPDSDRVQLRHELSCLKRTLRVKETEIRRLQQKQKGGKIKASLQRSKKIQKEVTPSIEEVETPQHSTSGSPPSSSPPLVAESAPPPQQLSPTLRVKHVEDGEVNQLSILWQGRGNGIMSQRGTPQRSLLAPGRVTRADQYFSNTGPSPERRRLERRLVPSSERRPSLDVQRHLPPPLDVQRNFPPPTTSRNATVDLGDFYRRVVPTPLSSNSTEELSQGKPRWRRASDILAGVRSPPLLRTAPSVPPVTINTGGVGDNNDRYKRLEEGLKQRVHRL